MISSCRRVVAVLACGIALVGAPMARATATDPGRAGEPGASCAPAGAADAPVPPVGLAACPEVRPGDSLYSEFGDSSSRCVIGPMYADRRGNRYFITGPDCAPPYAFEAAVTTWTFGKGPIALDGRSGKRIGEWVFRFSASSGGLSMVRLYPGIQANPQICQYGGPTGLNTAVSEDPTTLVMVGDQGGFLSYDLRPYADVQSSLMRPGVAAEGLYDPNLVLVAAENVVEYGMPVVTDDGLLVGISDYYGSEQRGSVVGISTGMVVVRPTKPMTVAAKVLRTTFTLLTAPLV